MAGFLAGDLGSQGTLQRRFTQNPANILILLADFASKNTKHALFIIKIHVYNIKASSWINPLQPQAQKGEGLDES